MIVVVTVVAKVVMIAFNSDSGKDRDSGDNNDGRSYSASVTVGEIGVVVTTVMVVVILIVW